MKKATKGEKKMKKAAMKIDELTIGDAKQIASMFGSMAKDESFFIPGNAYFIRTVTHHHIGTLDRMNRNGEELILTGASWIADDGRFHDALKNGKFSEVEPFLDGMEVLINRSSIIDAVKWEKNIPRSQK